MISLVIIILNEPIEKILKPFIISFTWEIRLEEPLFIRHALLFIKGLSYSMETWHWRLPATVNSRYLELSYRVVILCKLIRMGPIVLFETSRVRLIEYSRYRDSTVYTYGRRSTKLVNIFIIKKYIIFFIFNDMFPFVNFFPYFKLLNIYNNIHTLIYT